MSQITRKDFLAMGTMGMMGMMGAGTALADIEFPADAAQGIVDIMTPAELETRGGSAMPLEELNRRRQELLDSKSDDWVCEDGTVIPNVYVKLRTLFHSYGFGIGNELTDTCFDFWMFMFTEEEAQAYLEAPMGVFFTMLDYVQKTGRDFDESAAMWEGFAERGLCYAVTRGGMRYYRQIAFLQGANEYTQKNYETVGLPYIGMFRNATAPDGVNRALYSASSFYYALPCDKSIVDGELNPHDDYEAILDANEVFAVVPCFCRMGALIASGQEFPGYDADLSDLILEAAGQRVETCVQIGEFAEFVLNTGVGRRIDREEARDIIRRAVDDGCVLESCHSQTHEVICCCHGATCGHMKIYTAFDPEVLAASNVMPHISHFALAYDKDSCLKCGACADRCTNGAITMDAEGYPVVNARCFRCGQCGMVCPVSARKLQPIPEEECTPLPFGELEDDNMKAAYRFEHGLVW